MLLCSRRCHRGFPWLMCLGSVPASRLSSPTQRPERLLNVKGFLSVGDWEPTPGPVQQLSLSALMSMAAPRLSTPAPLTAFLCLLPLLRSAVAAFFPLVINEGPWICVPIPGGLCFNSEIMEQSFCLAVSGGWGQGLAAGRTFRRGINYWDVFLLKFFLLADLVCLFWVLWMNPF